MAQRPLRPCRHPGCRALTREGWCPRHRPAYRRGESAAWRALYDLPIWRNQLRPQQLLREPFCQASDCDALRETGRPALATVVDHIRPHRGDLALFSAPENLQSLCKRCHDRKTLRERRERGR